MKLKKLFVLLLLAFSLTACIGQSKGEKAAEEVNDLIMSGDIKKATELIDKYSSELKGQDLFDFSDNLMSL